MAGFCFFLKITGCRFERRLEVFRSLRPHVSDENGHRKSNFSKTLSAVKIFLKPFPVLACGRKITEIFENDDITVSGLKWGKMIPAPPFSSYKTTENVDFVLFFFVLFCSYAQVNVQISFSRIWLLVPTVRVRW